MDPLVLRLILFLGANGYFILKPLDSRDRLLLPSGEGEMSFFSRGDVIGGRWSPNKR